MTGCPDESVWLLYVDGEADEAERRRLDAHLVGCRDCRGTVVALERESTLLMDALQERERRSPLRQRAAAPAAPEPGVALGLPVAIAAVTAALAAAGFLLEGRLPGGLDYLNPLRLKGAYEMAFDLVFLVRDRAPGLIELALSVGVMASISAVLTLAVGAFSRRLYGAAALLACAFLVLPADPAGALEMRIDQDTSVGSDEVVAETMFLSGDRVSIDGVVEGDVWVAAERVIIGGTVKGNVYALVRDLELNGTVEGSVVGAIEQARLQGKVEDSVYAAAENLTLAPDAEIGRDLSLVAESCLLGGRVARDVTFGGEEIEVRGSVGRDVEVRWGERALLGDDARIGGSLLARLPEEDRLKSSDGAQVAGGIRFEARDGGMHHAWWQRYRSARFYTLHALGLVAGFLFGLLLRWAAPRLMESELSTSPQFFRSLGYGFLVLVATPVAIVALALTVVGLPIAVLTTFVYVVMVYSAELLVGAWVGRALLPPREEGWYAWSRSFFVGLAVLVVATHLPFVGVPITIVATLIGAGLFVEALREAAPLPRSA